MPCNSDYLEASHYERDISRVACLLDEIRAGAPTWDRSSWDGYHPRVYNKCNKELGDRLTHQLCKALSQLDVRKYSLEMQMWWRVHQAADEVCKAADRRNEDK